jgi:cytoskeletal protein CcmA (bactofilin family)
MNIEDFKASRFNIIGKKTKLKGEIELDGKTSISGEIVGNIFASEGSDIVIEKSGRIHGNIQAFNVEIKGQVEGEIHARGTLSIKAGSQVSGIIQAERLVIYPGAQVNSKADAG